MGPYGKHQPKFKRYENRHDSGVPDADVSNYTIYEGPDPIYWCDHGYGILHADHGGAWGSEGALTVMTRQEAQDCFDLIEWAAEQDWSNGIIGMSGVSYLAWSQWQVAVLNPPHLVAIFRLVVTIIPTCLFRLFQKSNSFGVVSQSSSINPVRLSSIR
jgi:putative CocE/NonD family hydrolase